MNRIYNPIRIYNHYPTEKFAGFLLKTCNIHVSRFVLWKVSYPAQGTAGKYPEFCLASRTAKEGTVSPIYFVVLNNDSALTLEIVQRWTYYHTYMNYNRSGSIRLPALTQVSLDFIPIWSSIHSSDFTIIFSSTLAR
jgi:hypothetical protein